MAQFMVRGTDRHTGAERWEVLEAFHEEDARGEAEKLGIVVSRVLLAETPAEALDYRGSSGNRTVVVPAYRGLVWGAVVLRVISVVYLIGAIAASCMAAGVVATSQSMPLGVVGAIPLVIGSLAAVAGGAIFFALASGCHALRDIAISSWAWRNR